MKLTFEELAEYFDANLEGNWKTIDYDLNKARTTLSHYNDVILVYFGDEATIPQYKLQLLLLIENNGEVIKIKNVELGGKNYSSYNNELLENLKNIEIVY